MARPVETVIGAPVKTSPGMIVFSLNWCKEKLFFLIFHVVSEISEENALQFFRSGGKMMGTQVISKDV